MPNQYTNKAGQEQPKMIGQKFGRLLVVNYNKEISKRKKRDCYLARCDCGEEKIVDGRSLRSRKTKSCGCLRDEKCSKRMSKMNEQLNRLRVGENNPAYYHGFDIGREKFRKTVHERDKVCQHDGKHKGQLEAHHLNGDHDDNDPKNSSLLCCSHHKIVTINGNIWRPEL